VEHIWQEGSDRMDFTQDMRGKIILLSDDVAWILEILRKSPRKDFALS